MSEDAFTPIVASAERLLGRTLGREVRLADVTRLSDVDRRNLLLRCRDLSGEPPGNFIIKKVVAETYAPEDVASWDMRRFFSDWGGAAFLSASLDPPRSPRFYGGDYSQGFFVLEDLGDQRSLVEPLLEDDAASAEKTLLSFSVSLGAMHAATIGESARFEELLRSIGPQVGICARAVTGLHDLGKVRTSLDALGVIEEPHFSNDIEEVVSAIENPGPFFSYIHGDPCPDNMSWSGEALRLIDFEFGGFGHALMDGAYGRMLFPTCWCANRLPTDLVSRMESTYRRQLVGGCPEAEDDRVFEAALARVCGYWLLATLSRSLPRAIEADSMWGIATIRQRLFARLEAFITTAEAFGQLTALRATAARLLEVIRKRWPDTRPLPLYPAFNVDSTTSENW